MSKEIEFVDQDMLCGANQEGHRRKQEWCEQNYPLGLKSKQLRFEETGEWIGAIEYIPGEYAWRASGRQKLHGYPLHCRCQKTQGARLWVSTDRRMHTGCKKTKDGWCGGTCYKENMVCG